MRQLVIVPVLILLFAAAPAAQHWPQWRGPQLNGISTERNLPLRWSKTENVVWSLPLPEWSGSTPIVWGDYVSECRPWQRSLPVDHRP